MSPVGMEHKPDRLVERHFELFSEAEALLNSMMQLINQATPYMEHIDPEWVDKSTETLTWARDHKTSVEKSYDVEEA